MDRDNQAELSLWTTGSEDHWWVTGGRDLLLWEQLPSSEKQRGDITAKRDSRLDSLMESEGDTEDDEETDDYEEDDDKDEGSGSWLCCVLQ
eukprot:superscaffoldBa00005590_g20537